jgi:hypothetical protein
MATWRLIGADVGCGQRRDRQRAAEVPKIDLLRVALHERELLVTGHGPRAVAEHRSSHVGSARSSAALQLLLRWLPGSRENASQTTDPLARERDVMVDDDGIRQSRRVSR